MAQGLINNGVSITKSFSPNEYELIADYTVDVARTSYTFNGFKLNADEEVVLVSELYNSGASNTITRLFVNGNTTETNYYAQEITADGTSVSGARYNFPVFISASSSYYSVGIANIKLTNNGYFIYQLSQNRNNKGNTANLGIYNYHGTSTFTLSQITSITLVSTISSAIGIGSRFQLYKVKGQVQQTWATT